MPQPPGVGCRRLDQSGERRPISVRSLLGYYTDDRTARPVRNFERCVVHACVPDLRSASCSFEARKQDVAFEIDVLGEVGCELVDARIEARNFRHPPAPRIRVPRLRRRARLRHAGRVHGA